jgi:hypothetical protein
VRKPARRGDRWFSLPVVLGANSGKRVPPTDPPASRGWFAIAALPMIFPDVGLSIIMKRIISDLRHLCKCDQQSYTLVSSGAPRISPGACNPVASGQHCGCLQTSGERQTRLPPTIVIAPAILIIVVLLVLVGFRDPADAITPLRSVVTFCWFFAFTFSGQVCLLHHRCH